VTERDETLAQNAQAGDIASLDELLHRYKKVVKDKARSVSAPGLECDDLLQEGMIGLFKSIRDYRPGFGASFKVFAAMCVERQITSALRAATRQKHTPLNYSVPFDHPLVTDDSLLRASRTNASPLSVLISREELKTARGAFTVLETRVLGLRLKGKSYRDIADALDVDTKTVDNALNRAKRKLEK
jgi:RNA polymerase sporulation-specific sigma factor